MAAALDGVPDRRHEVGQGLAGAGARLHGQVLARGDRPPHGLGHVVLAVRRVPPTAATATSSSSATPGSVLGDPDSPTGSPVETEAVADAIPAGYRAGPVPRPDDGSRAAPRLSGLPALVEQAGRPALRRRGTLSSSSVTATDSAATAPPEPSLFPVLVEHAAHYSDLDPSRRIGRDTLVRWFEDARVQLGREALEADLSDRAEGLCACWSSRSASTCWPRCASPGDYRIGIGVTASARRR